MIAGLPGQRHPARGGGSRIEHAPGRIVAPHAARWYSPGGMRRRLLAFSLLLAAAAGCARSAGAPGLVCVPAAQAPPYAAAGSWYCQEVAVTVREPSPQPEQHRAGQYADLVVTAVGRCPDGPGPFAPRITVKNAGPVPAGAFNVAVDVGVFDTGGAPAVSTAAVARVPGLAAGAEVTVTLERLQALTLRPGDRLTVTAIADPQQAPGSAPLHLFGEILELDESNNSAVQNCTVPGG